MSLVAALQQERYVYLQVGTKVVLQQSNDLEALAGQLQLSSKYLFCVKNHSTLLVLENYDSNFPRISKFLFHRVRNHVNEYHLSDHLEATYCVFGYENAKKIYPGIVKEFENPEKTVLLWHKENLLRRDHNTR